MSKYYYEIKWRDGAIGKWSHGGYTVRYADAKAQADELAKKCIFRTVIVLNLEKNKVFYAVGFNGNR